MLEAEDHADDVERFQDFPDASDAEAQPAAQQSPVSMTAQQAQQRSNLSKDSDASQQPDTSSEEEEAVQGNLDTSDSEEDAQTAQADDVDMRPSTSGRGDEAGGKRGPQDHAGPGVSLMGVYDMRKRYA